MIVLGEVGTTSVEDGGIVLGGVDAMSVEDETNVPVLAISKS
jgi:hypothetical protein